MSDGAQTSKRKLSILSNTPYSQSSKRQRPASAEGQESPCLPRYSREDYTIGWLAAVHTEMSAALAMLDERHADIDDAEPDGNTYALGKIQKHNVVIAGLPDGCYGTVSAAVVATNMRRSFPSLRLQLVVGIAGGIPGEIDDRLDNVRLGDVVVGQAFIQHDYGKLRNGRLVPKGVLYEPPLEARTAITALRARNSHRPSLIPQIWGRSLQNNPEMAGFMRKDCLQDRLFDSSYTHSRADKECAGCDLSRLRNRPARPNNDPVVHYGVILSGDSLVKDAKERDVLGTMHNALCIEMEAAGLAGSSSSLIIRGICDYADSHKNDEWQPYAAAAAAAYAKDFLSALPSRQNQIPIVMSTSGNLRDNTSSRHQVPRSPTETMSIKRPGDDEQIEEMAKLLDFDQSNRRHELIQSARAKTCRWLLERPEFQDWLNPSKLRDHHGIFWIKGKPGAGKSTLMKFALKEVKKEGKNKSIISFFFNARGDNLEKSTAGMYRSLLSQLLRAKSSRHRVFEAIQRTLGDSTEPQWTVELLQQLFEDAVLSLGNQMPLLCLIDALDECDERQIRQMASFFTQLGELAISTNVQFHVCFASRYYPHITIRTKLELMLEKQEGHGQDIANYILKELNIGHCEISTEIRQEMRKKASGIFMWVVLVVQILNEEHDGGSDPVELRTKLREIPERLHDLFKDILSRDDKRKDHMLLCIQWILFSTRPLTLEELYTAIRFRLSSKPGAPGELCPNDLNVDLMVRFVLSVSKGLVEITRTKPQRVQFIHESVNDFFLRDNGLRVIWPNMEMDFQARGHKELRDCCASYIMHSQTQLELPGHPPNSPDHQVTISPQKVVKSFPLLEYATPNVIYHADIAQSHSPSQEQVQDICKVLEGGWWVKLSNFFVKYARRRYHDDTTSLYILAEYNASYLIRAHPAINTCFLDKRGRYGPPILAAIASGSDKAVEAFFNAHGIFPDAIALDRILGKGPGQEGIQLKFGRNFEYDHENSLLIHVLERGSEDLLALCLRQECVKKFINYKNYKSTTPLKYALLHHPPKIIRLLIENGAIIHAPCDIRSTPLSWAIDNAPSSVVRLLLDTSPNHDSIRIEGWTPLGWAVRFGLEATVKVLLDEGASTETRDDWGRTALSYVGSIYRGGTEKITRTANLLLEHGAQVNVIDRSGKTPLMAAATLQSAAFVQLMLDLGSPIDKTDKLDRTALHAAAQVNSAAAVELLLERGATVDMHDNAGRTPLGIAAWEGSPAAARLLVSRGAVIEAQDKWGRTPLSLAAKSKPGSSIGYTRFGEVIQTKETYLGCQEVIKLLLKTNASTETVDREGRTPLSLAAEVGSTQAVQLLLDAGAKVDATDRVGRTPLFYAAMNGLRDIYLPLLENGAAVEAIDNFGRTPLVYAAASGFSVLVKLLLDKGAVIPAEDIDAWEPVKRAIEQGSDYSASIKTLQTFYSKHRVIEEVVDVDAT